MMSCAGRANLPVDYFVLRNSEDLNYYGHRLATVVKLRADRRDLPLGCAALGTVSIRQPKNEFEVIPTEERPVPAGSCIIIQALLPFLLSIISFVIRNFSNAKL